MRVHKLLDDTGKPVFGTLWACVASFFSLQHVLLLFTSPVRMLVVPVVYAFSIGQLSEICGKDCAVTPSNRMKVTLN